MRRFWLFLLLLGTLEMTYGQSQPSVEWLKAVNLSKWKIPAGDYSGITWLGDNRYAVVSDQEEKDGFFLFHINMDLKTGEITQVSRSELKGDESKKEKRDEEGIAYFPAQHTFFISGEHDQRIKEYDENGNRTGRELAVPEQFDKHHIHFNYGFESLAYSSETHRFWTITESCLKMDGEPAGPEHPEAINLLRLQSFDDNLQPQEQYAYHMDICKARKQTQHYAYGVSDIAALPDGRLLVLEREFYVASSYLGSFVLHKIYLVNPSETEPISFSDAADKISEKQILHKLLVADFTTHLRTGKMDLANYEGMCLGPKLEDGRQTLLLINDSQHHFGNGAFHLKDYLRVLIF